RGAGRSSREGEGRGHHGTEERELRRTLMKAITVTDRGAGTGGMTLQERPTPHAAENDVIVEVRAAGFTPGELAWPATWTDRAGRDRTPSIPGHELSGVVAEVPTGTTGLTVG